MASIVDSIRSVYTDSFSLLKLGVFGAAIYFLYTLLVPSKYFNPLNMLAISMIISSYLGFCSIIINHRINQKIEVLPTLNVIKFIKVSIISFLLFLPFLFINMTLISFVLGLFSFEGLPQQIALWMVRFVVFCAYITCLINYSEKFSISDGVNISKLTNGLADVIVYTIVGMILLVIYGIFLVFPVLFLLHTFFQFGPLFQYATAFFVTLNIAYMADYWGQLHYDIQSRDNYY